MSAIYVTGLHGDEIEIEDVRGDAGSLSTRLALYSVDGGEGHYVYLSIKKVKELRKALKEAIK